MSIQESVRAAIDQLQYGSRRAAVGRPVYGPAGAPGAPEDSYWRGTTAPGTDPTAVPMPGAPAGPGAAPGGRHRREAEKPGLITQQESTAGRGCEALTPGGHAAAASGRAARDDAQPAAAAGH